MGLYYYGARWLDVSLGRFLSADSIIPEATQGVQAFDRYAYANNNPARYSDPTGHRVDDGCQTEGCAVEKTHRRLESPKPPFDSTLGGNNANKSVDNDEPSKPITTAEKIGLVVTGGVLVVGLTAAEISHGVLAVGLLDLGPFGVVVDVGVIAPSELFLIDVEISYARYLSEVFKTETKEGLNLELTIFPTIIDIFKRH